MTLRELNVGESARIASVGGDERLRRRLLDMGLTPGTSVSVRKIAPLGDPVELMLRGYVLTIRLDEAEKIAVNR